MKSNYAPIFVTIEGIDGAGKTSAITQVTTQLVKEGYDVCPTSAVGGSKYGVEIRKVFLCKEAIGASSTVHAMIVGAAIHDHRETVVKQALEAGQIVICDRGILSMLSYQASSDHVHEIATIAEAGIRPHLTILLDVTAEVSLSRTQARAVEGVAIDEFNRYDDQKLEELSAKRKVMLDWYKLNKHKAVIIQASGSLDSVVSHIYDAILEASSKVAENKRVLVKALSASSVGNEV